jgi:hypothetical protein
MIFDDQTPAVTLPRRRGKTLRAASLIVLILTPLFWAVSLAADDKTGDTIGTIEGDSIAVEGPMTVDVVHGQIKTVLRSGSDVRVKAGDARIDLVEGGQIVICGPAHLSLLKSGGALTVALDSGTVRAHLDHGPALIIYTAQIQAKPISVGNAPQDILVGFDNPATMCVRAASGAVRLEQQLTAQSLVVPQNGDILLTNAQFETLQNATGHCACELPIAKTIINPPSDANRASNAEQTQTVAQTQSQSQSTLDAKPAPKDGKDQPTYEVFMPPLTYDAKLKDHQQNNFDPDLIVIVRRVRVRPTLIFQGQVQGDPPPAPNTTAAASSPATAAPAPPKPVPQPPDSVFDRMRSFLHRFWNHSS